MTEYALLINNEFKEIRNFSSKPDGIPHKNIVWYDVVREYGVPFTGLENGNWVIRTVDPATLPTPVPAAVTPRQVRLLLLQQNLLSTVLTMMEQQPEAAKITWEYAIEFQRTDPLLNSLGAALGLTSQQIDEFFIAASQL